MFITNENITTDGVITEFTLANSFKAGTLLITYNDNLFYEFSEKTGSNDVVVFDFAPEADDSVLISYYTENSPRTGNAIQYASVRQAREKSLITEIKDSTVTDETLTTYLRDIEAYIDTIVGGWTPANDNQQLTFPREEDKTVDYTLIPQDITRAALLAVDNMHLLGTQSNAADGSTTKSEKLGDYSYTKEGGIAAVNAFDYAKQMLGSRASALIFKYIRKLGKLQVSHQTTDTNLNSRQKWVINNE